MSVSTSMFNEYFKDPVMVAAMPSMCDIAVKMMETLKDQTGQKKKLSSRELLLFLDNALLPNITASKSLPCVHKLMDGRCVSWFVNLSGTDQWISVLAIPEVRDVMADRLISGDPNTNKIKRIILLLGYLHETNKSDVAQAVLDNIFVKIKATLKEVKQGEKPMSSLYDPPVLTRFQSFNR